jgi:uncharacterized protein
MQPTHVPFAPVEPKSRLDNIDFARGMALLGIFFVNSTFFFQPLGAQQSAASILKLTGIDFACSFAIYILCQLKFISLFSLLFGYGLSGQFERIVADDAGSTLWFGFCRLAALAMFGLLHAIFLWYGDILFFYAILGGFLLVARFCSTRVLLLIACLLLGLNVLIRLGIESAQVAFADQIAQSTEAAAKGDSQLRGFEAVRRSGNPSSITWMTAETMAYQQGPWGDAMLFRVISWLAGLFTMLIAVSPQILGMFFLGAVLWRWKFFEPQQWNLRLRTCLTCLPLGLLLQGSEGAIMLLYPQDKILLAVGGVLQQSSLFFLPLGYLATFAVIAECLPSLLIRPICNAGRMSLSVYLSETVITTGISYHWGLGWFGTLSTSQQTLTVFLIWLSLLAVATLWLQFFSQGPMEWLWRKMAYKSRKNRNLTQESENVSRMRLASDRSEPDEPSR